MGEVGARYVELPDSGRPPAGRRSRGALRIGIGVDVGRSGSGAGRTGGSSVVTPSGSVGMLSARAPSEESWTSATTATSDTGDGCRSCGDESPAAHRTILEPPRDAVGNPCTARYVDPVRVGSLLRGSSTLGRADGTPPPRHRAVRARARCARCCAAPRPLARRHVRYRRPVHAERPCRDQHPHGPPARRDDDARAEPLEQHADRPRDADRDRAPHRSAGDDRRHQRRLLRVRGRPAERRPDAGGAGDEPAVRLPCERRRHVRRHARRPQGLPLGHLAGRRRQAHAEPVQQAARQEGRHRALHRGVGADHAADARRRVGDPVPVSGSDPEHRSPGSGCRAPHGRRRDPDPARWCRSRRGRRCSCSAHGGGACRPARHGAAHPQARLAGHRLRHRRRPADRPRRRPCLPGGRDLHDEPARRRARRGAPSASSPTARWSSSRSMAASPGTRSG